VNSDGVSICRPHNYRLIRWPLSLVTRHTSHVTRHTSHVTHHTSHITRHTSHLTLAQSGRSIVRCIMRAMPHHLPRVLAGGMQRVPLPMACGDARCRRGT
jgi:hypothetical protein